MIDIETPIPIEGPYVVATFDFEAMLPHEITFGEGDEIGLLGYIDEAWARAWFRGKEGAVPLDFVRVVEDLPGERVYEGWPEEWLPDEDPADHQDEERDEELPAGLLEASEKAAAAAIAEGEGADAGEAFQPKSGVAPTQPMPLPKPKPKPKPKADGGGATGDAPTPKPKPKPKPGQAASGDVPLPKPKPKPAAKDKPQPEPKAKPEMVKTPRIADMSSEIPTARALHTYEASAPDEMTIVEGQMVRLGVQRAQRREGVCRHLPCVAVRSALHTR